MSARTIRRLRTGWRGYGRWLAAAAVGFAALQFVTAGAVSGAPGDITEYPVPTESSNPADHPRRSVLPISRQRPPERNYHRPGREPVVHRTGHQHDRADHPHRRG